MAKYNEEQSTVIALWVLAIINRGHPDKQSIKGGMAPRSIVHLVNALGEDHSPSSILLHTHGYDRLLLGRSIDRSVTELQKKVARKLKEEDIIKKVFSI